MGRWTPSPQLEIAAEFIASRFRAAGLKPGGDHDYFQVAEMVERRLPKVTAAAELAAGTKRFTIEANDLHALNAPAETSGVKDAPVKVVNDPNLDVVRTAAVKGSVIALHEPDFSKSSGADSVEQWLACERFLSSSNAAGVLIISDGRRRGRESNIYEAAQAREKRVPLLVLSGQAATNWLAEARTASPLNATFALPAAVDHPFQAKNVVGVLPGADPKLKETAVMLSAHYDHIGTAETGKNLAPPVKGKTNDTIFNGANDDGSGTVSVIAVAQALARLKPKRSIVFVTFFGEERGELGSEYYAQNPAVPLARTVADLNLEQMGRTDASNGAQVNTASPTGFDYSDLTKFLIGAGTLTGVKIYRDPEGSDAYFTRSDNNAMAQAGVPAHTLCVAFDFSDYHGLDDNWTKIDYENMARVDRTVALALLNIANSAKVPQWNAANAKTAPFREAQRKLLNKSGQ